MTVRVLALGSLALFLPANHSTDLAHRPDLETEWTLSFEEASVFEIESMLQTIGGTEISAPMPEMLGTISRNIEVTDQVLSAEDGRATSRARTFDEIKSECSLNVAFMGQEDVFEIDFASELADEDLTITWSDADDRYEFEFDGDDAPNSDLLEGLLEDLDYKFLLPPDGVEEGDSWEIDLADAGPLFSPGGRLHLMPKEAPEVRGNVIDAHDLVAIAGMSIAESSRSITGELRATWSETVEHGDAKHAVILLELEGELSAELAESIEVMTSSVGLASREDYDFESLWEIEGRGQLHWDLDAGHFRTLDLEIESIVVISLSFTETFGEIEVEVETSGTTKLTARASAE